jgi:squalene-associated FAD-dependent desaturase
MGSNRADVLILGGGFSGLSAGVTLSRRGAKVVLLEKKPHLGGRAFSFHEPGYEGPIDNGQHLFLACYHETRKFLRSIGTEDRLEFSKRLHLEFADRSGKRDRLSPPAGLSGRWGLGLGVATLSSLSLRDKWGLARFFHRMSRAAQDGGFDPGLDTMTAAEWLQREGVTPRGRERLLDPIVLAALNEKSEVASATGLAQVLSKAFFAADADPRIGIARVGLSDLYTDAARRAIEEAGGGVLLSQRVAAIEEGPDGRVSGARTATGAVWEARTVLSCLAPWDLAKIELPKSAQETWRELRPAPIVSVSLWLDKPLLRHEETFVGLLGTENQWVFNKSAILASRLKSGASLARSAGQYLSAVISGAHRELSWQPNALIDIACRDLARCFPAFRREWVRGAKVVKEPFATLSGAPGAEALRPFPGEMAPGFFVAGDWTRTGLPATIESAVLSASMACGRIS